MKDMPQTPTAVAMGNVRLYISLDSTTLGTTLSAVFTIAKLTLACGWGWWENRRCKHDVTGRLRRSRVRTAPVTLCWNR